MPFTKGQSGNPSGGTPGKKYARNSPLVVQKAIKWALRNMDKEPGTEGKAPSGVAAALLREARENSSKFLDRVERMWKASKDKGSEKEEPLNPQDVKFGETIDRLLEEFGNAQSGSVGRGGSPGAARKPEMAAASEG
jgi:hypothetical protein